MIAFAQAAADWRELLDEARRFLMPEMILTAFACLILVSGASWRNSRKFVTGAALLGVLLSGLSLVVVEVTLGASFPKLGFSRMFILDGLAVAFKCLTLFAVAVSVVLASRASATRNEPHSDVIALVMLSAVGMMVAASSYDLLALCVSLELTAVPLCVLAGFGRAREAAAEAALKLFLTGAVSTAILLYGVSLVYGLTGETNLADINARVPALLARTGDGGPQLLLTISLVLCAAGLGLRLAAVPFQVWISDLFEAAPVPVTAFVSTGAIAAVVVAGLRLLLEGAPGLLGDGNQPSGLLFSIGVCGAASVLWSGIAALTQRNLLRLVANATVLHVGVILAGLSAGNRAGYVGLVIVLAVYAVAMAGTLGVLASAGDSVRRTASVRGLAGKSGFRAALMTLFLLTLAGFPPAAGFLGRAYVLLGLTQSSGAWTSLAAACVALAWVLQGAGCLVLIRDMYVSPGDDDEGLDTNRTPRTSRLAASALTALGVLTAGAGLYPSPLVDVAQGVVRRLLPAASTEAPVRTTIKPFAR